MFYNFSMNKIKNEKLWRVIKANEKVFRREFKRMTHKNNSSQKSNIYLEVVEGTLTGFRGMQLDRINALTLAKLIIAFIKSYSIKKLHVAHDGTLDTSDLELFAIRIINALELKAFVHETRKATTIGQASFVIREKNLDGGVYISSEKNKIKIILLDSFGAPLNKKLDKKLNQKMRGIIFEKMSFDKCKINNVSKAIYKKYESMVIELMYRKKDTKLLTVFLGINNATDITIQRLIAKCDIKFNDVTKLKFLALLNNDLLLLTNNDASELYVQEGKKKFTMMEITLLYLNYLLTQFKYKDLKSSKMFISTFKGHKQIIKLAQIHKIDIHKTTKGAYNNFIGKNSVKNKIALVAVDHDGRFLTVKTNYPDALVYMCLVIEMANYYKTQNKTLTYMIKWLKDLL